MILLDRLTYDVHGLSTATLPPLERLHFLGEEPSRTMPIRSETESEIPSLVIERISTLDAIRNTLKRYLGDKLIYCDLEYDKNYGNYVRVLVSDNASNAMKTWLQVLDAIKHLKIPIFFEWLGENDLSPEELGMYVAIALIKMELHPATEKPIDFLKILKKERE